MNQILLSPPPPSIIGYHQQQQTQRQESQQHVHLHIAGFYNIEGFWNGQLEEQLIKIRNKEQQRHMKSNATTTANYKNTTTISMVPQFDSTEKWDGGIDTIIPLLDFIIMNHVEATNIINCAIDRRKRCTRHHSSTIGEKKDCSTSDHDKKKNHNDDADDNDNSIHQYWATHFKAISNTTTYIITLGKDGAIAIRDGRIIATRCTVKIDNPIDPTGAGDSFAAGFLHGIWTWRREQQRDGGGGEIEETKVDTNSATLFWPDYAIEYGLRWGCAVGTASVMIRGASEPAKMADIESYM